MSKLVNDVLLSIVSDSIPMSETLKTIIENGLDLISKNRNKKLQKRLVDFHKKLLETNEKINLNEKDFDALSYEKILEVCLEDIEENKLPFYSNLMNNIYLNKIEKNQRSNIITTVKKLNYEALNSLNEAFTKNTPVISNDAIMASLSIMALVAHHNRRGEMTARGNDVALAISK